MGCSTLLMQCTPETKTPALKKHLKPNSAPVLQTVHTSFLHAYRNCFFPAALVSSSKGIKGVLNSYENFVSDVEACHFACLTNGHCTFTVADILKGLPQ